ncbi:MAG: hypothetical protein EOO49_04600 [Flavobacterium sp.]|nr:MAG: hypothetical protein EOO49_04600 [Flavobacterium sp.]
MFHCSNTSFSVKASVRCSVVRTMAFWDCSSSRLARMLESESADTGVTCFETVVSVTEFCPSETAICVTCVISWVRICFGASWIGGATTTTSGVSTSISLTRP